MPKIASIGTYRMPYTLPQQEIERLTKELFQERAHKLERLFTAFQNGGIQQRQFCVPPEWHRQHRSFQERNHCYIQLAVEYGVAAIQTCLNNLSFLTTPLSTEEIDAIIFVSTTGIATPSIDARIMNVLPFSDRIKRLPLFGLGCAGGAAGISHAFDYCKMRPTAKVLVVCVELCSLTFQPNDYRKSNLIGASLFADGVACVLICGDEATLETKDTVPSIQHSASKWLPNSENVMGWDVRDHGLHVIFQKSIPQIITQWLPSFMEEFLSEQQLTIRDIPYFVAHPGGKKVLGAYEEALQFTSEQTATAKAVLQQYGNMSSPTVLYVLEQFMLQNKQKTGYGLLVALGPGFCGEAVLLNWGAN